MPKVVEPDRIALTSATQLTAEFNALLAALHREETEHTWEIIDKAVKRFHAVVRGGVHKTFPEEFIRGMKDKDVVKGIIRSLITERTRLSGTTLDLIAAMTRLSTHFQPLLHIYLPTILRLLCRTNKLYITRASACLNSIITHTRLLGDVLKHIVAEWRAEAGKSSSFREKCAEALGVMLGTTDAAFVVDKESLERRMEDLEWVIRIGATDREPKVRSEIKKCWEAYKGLWPERVNSFTAPMTPIIRRYLNVAAGPVGGGAPSGAASSSLSASTRAPPKKPKVPASLSSSVSASSAAVKPSTSSSATRALAANAASSSSFTAAPKATGTRSALSASHGPSSSRPIVPAHAALSKSIGPGSSAHAPSSTRPPVPDMPRTVSANGGGSGPPSRTASRTDLHQHAEESATQMPSGPLQQSHSRSGSASLQSSESTSSFAAAQSRSHAQPIHANTSSSSSSTRYAPTLPSTSAITTLSTAAASSSTSRPFKPSVTRAQSSTSAEPRKARRVIAPPPAAIITPGATPSTSSGSLSRSTAASSAVSGNAPPPTRRAAASASAGPFRPHATTAGKGMATTRPVPGSSSSLRGTRAPTAATMAKIVPVKEEAVAKVEPTLAVETFNEISDVPADAVADTKSTAVAAETNDTDVVDERLAPDHCASLDVATVSNEGDVARLVNISEDDEYHGGDTASVEVGTENVGATALAAEANVLDGLHEDTSTIAEFADEDIAIESQDVRDEVGMESTIWLNDSQPAEEQHQTEPDVEAEVEAVAEPDAGEPEPQAAKRSAENEDRQEAADDELNMEVKAVEVVKAIEESGTVAIAAVEDVDAVAAKQAVALTDNADAETSEQEGEDDAVVDVPQSADCDDGEEKSATTQTSDSDLLLRPSVDLIETEDVDGDEQADAMAEATDDEAHEIVEKGAGSSSTPAASPRRSSASATSLTPVSPTFSSLPAAPPTPKVLHYVDFDEYASPERAQTCSIIMETPPRFDLPPAGEIRLPWLRMGPLSLGAWSSPLRSPAVELGNMASPSIKLPRREEHSVHEDEDEAEHEAEHEADSDLEDEPTLDADEPLVATALLTPEYETDKALTLPAQGIDVDVDESIIEQVQQDESYLNDEPQPMFLPDDSVLDQLVDSSYEASVQDFDVPLNDASVVTEGEEDEAVGTETATETEEEEEEEVKFGRLDPTTHDERFCDEMAPTIVIAPECSATNNVDDFDEGDTSIFGLVEEKELAFGDEEQDQEQESSVDDEETDDSVALERPTSPEPETEREETLVRSLRSRVVKVELEKKTPAKTAGALRSRRSPLGELQ